MVNLATASTVHRHGPVPISIKSAHRTRLCLALQSVLTRRPAFDSCPQNLPPPPPPPPFDVPLLAAPRTAAAGLRRCLLYILLRIAFFPPFLSTLFFHSATPPINRNAPSPLGSAQKSFPTWHQTRPCCQRRSPLFQQTTRPSSHPHPHHVFDAHHRPPPP